MYRMRYQIEALHGPTVFHWGCRAIRICYIDNNIQQKEYHKTACPARREGFFGPETLFGTPRRRGDRKRIITNLIRSTTGNDNQKNKTTTTYLMCLPFTEILILDLSLETVVYRGGLIVISNEEISG